MLFPRKAGLNLAPGEMSTFASFDIGMTTLRKIKDGEKKLFVYGVAAYNDVFDGTSRYYSEFCYALKLREDGYSFISVDEFTSEGKTAELSSVSPKELETGVAQGIEVLKMVGECARQRLGNSCNQLLFRLPMARRAFFGPSVV